MALDSTAKAIATLAWTRLLDSMVSGDPPGDVSQYYFFWHQITDYNHFQHNLKRLEIHKYKLGTENIRAKMSLLHSQVVQTNEQGVEHIQDSTRSVVPAYEDAQKQGIEHIQYGMRSGTPYQVVQTNEDETQQGIEHIQYSMRSGAPYKAVQADEDESQQGIEHVQYSMRSGAPYQVVQSNEDENQQGIEHVQYSMRSGAPYQVVQANEDENQQGIEQIGYGMSSITTSEAVQAYENENMQGIEHIGSTMRSSETFKPAEYKDHNTTSYIGKGKKVTRMPEEYEELADKKRYRRGQEREILNLYTVLELVKNGGLLGEEQPVLEPDLLELIASFHGLEVNAIRMAVEEEPEYMNQKYDDTEHIKKQKELFFRILETENFQPTMCKIISNGGMDCSEYYELVKTIEEKPHGINYIPYCIRPLVPSDVVRAIEYNTLQGLKSYLKRKYTRSTGLQKVLEETRHGFEKPFDNDEAKKLSKLFDELLELVEIGELHGNVKPKPETSYSVVRLMKLLYHYGLDTIQNGVEEELKEVNQKCDDVKEDPAMQCKKRLLETMLRICSIKTCQRTIHHIIGIALRGQMWQMVYE